jgi:hypothetical protein
VASREQRSSGRPTMGAVADPESRTEVTTRPGSRSPVPERAAHYETHIAGDLGRHYAAVQRVDVEVFPVAPDRRIAVIETLTGQLSTEASPRCESRTKRARRS